MALLFFFFIALGFLLLAGGTVW